MAFTAGDHAAPLSGATGGAEAYVLMTASQPHFSNSCSLFLRACGRPSRRVALGLSRSGSAERGAGYSGRQGHVLRRSERGRQRGRMAIDHDELLNFPISEVRQRLTKRDALLYALGRAGAGPARRASAGLHPRPPRARRGRRWQSCSAVPGGNPNGDLADGAFRGRIVERDLLLMTKGIAVFADAAVPASEAMSR